MFITVTIGLSLQLSSGLNSMIMTLATVIHRPVPEHINMCSALGKMSSESEVGICFLSPS